MWCFCHVVVFVGCMSLLFTIWLNRENVVQNIINVWHDSFKKLVICLAPDKSAKVHHDCDLQTNLTAYLFEDLKIWTSTAKAVLCRWSITHLRQRYQLQYCCGDYCQLYCENAMFLVWTMSVRMVWLLCHCIHRQKIFVIRTFSYKKKKLQGVTFSFIKKVTPCTFILLHMQFLVERVLHSICLKYIS